MPRIAPNLRRNLGMSRYWLREDLAKLDPVSDPTVYSLDPSAADGRKLCMSLGLDHRSHVHEGWLPRAKLVDALRAAAPLDAAALERAPKTDVGRWTVLFADATIRVASESFEDLAALVVAPPLSGCVVGYAKCIDGHEHEWDAEVFLDDRDDPAVDGPSSGCSRCGVPYDLWMPLHGEPI